LIHPHLVNFEAKGTTPQLLKPFITMKSLSRPDSSMSPSEMKSKSTASGSELKVVGYDERDPSGPCYMVQSPMGNILKISDTFCEMFPMWVSRFLITAQNEKWARVAAQSTIGFASSIIMSPAEAGIEKFVSSSETPDGRPGVIVQVYHRAGYALRGQLISRIGQCVMTCPTTAAYDALPQAKKRIRVGASIKMFGDGYQRKEHVGDRVLWKIPVMEGEFTVESRFGVKRGIAGGMLLILSEDQPSGLEAAEKAVEAIMSDNDGVILPFPGGICRSGSKVGSQKYKLPASTNQQFCPTLRTSVPDSLLPENVKSVYEIVVNSITPSAMKKALGLGIRAVARASGVLRITAANYGGRLGPYKLMLKDVLQT
jgi:formylmethanofuran--tetrahydromethanopterin N-formyltransferase